MYKLLFVDDKLEDIEHFGKKLGPEVLVVGLRASEVLSWPRPLDLSFYDALLIDLFMPETDGLSFFKDLEFGLGFKLPTFIISECFQPKYREMALELGIQDYLHKEMSGNEMWLRIKSRLDNGPAKFGI